MRLGLPPLVSCSVECAKLCTGPTLVKEPFQLKNREAICSDFKKVVLPHTLWIFYCLHTEDN